MLRPQSLRRLVLLATTMAALSGWAACAGETPPPPSSTTMAETFLVADIQGLSVFRLEDRSKSPLIQFDDRAQIAFPAVSPDGMSLAFCVLQPSVMAPDGRVDSGEDLYVATIDGRQIREVVHHGSTGELNLLAAWLTGEELIFEIRGQDGGKAPVHVDKVNVRPARRRSA